MWHTWSVWVWHRSVPFFNPNMLPPPASVAALGTRHHIANKGHAKQTDPDTPWDSWGGLGVNGAAVLWQSCVGQMANTR